MLAGNLRAWAKIFKTKTIFLPHFSTFLEKFVKIVKKIFKMGNLDENSKKNLQVPEILNFKDKSSKLTTLN